MRIAYKRGDGRKIDGRRVLVDVERGRTVRDWKVREDRCPRWSRLQYRDILFI